MALTLSYHICLSIVYSLIIKDHIQLQVPYYHEYKISKYSKYEVTLHMDSHVSLTCSLLMAHPHILNWLKLYLLLHCRSLWTFARKMGSEWGGFPLTHLLRLLNMPSHPSWLLLRISRNLMSWPKMQTSLLEDCNVFSLKTRFEPFQLYICLRHPYFSIVTLKLISEMRQHWAITIIYPFLV